MGALNSPGNELFVDLLENVFADYSAQIPSLHKSLLLDMKTIRQRVQHEGFPFLTKSLPLFGKAFDLALETNEFVCPTGFKLKSVSPNIPVFLSGVFTHCYDSDGTWNPDIQTVRFVRQICFMFYKYELPYDQDLTSEFLDSFKEVDRQLKSLEWTCTPESLESVSRRVAHLLSEFNFDTLWPKHGPGAVATGEKGDQKWEFTRLYDAIHQVFPYYDFYWSRSKEEMLDRASWYKGLLRVPSGTAKVCLVPKDSRGPRLISAEPLEYMYIQQAICGALVPYLESHPFTAGHINFSDQSVNANLALTSSVTREYATIDLKEASDRVSLKHIDRLFPEWFSKALRATRSTSTLLPSGEVIALNKFAPMGSALCFPVEALVFWAISIEAVVQQGVKFRHAVKSVYVYGDDIIVPTQYVHGVCKMLESFGLAVNSGKSYSRGFFRESCGMDAYYGVPVTPTRIKTPWSAKPTDGTAFASYTKYANALSAKGYPRASEYLYKMVESLYGKLPYGCPTSGFPCRVVHSAFKALILNLEAGYKCRYVADTQSIQIYTKTLKAKRYGSNLDGWPRVLRGLVSRNIEDPDVVVLRDSTQIKSKWCKLLS